MPESPRENKHTLQIPGARPLSENNKFCIDGLSPQWVVAPNTTDEICEFLKLANSQNWGIVPFGSGSKRNIGNVPSRFDVALSMRHLNQIPEYEPQDLVVKVESGCHLVDLQKRLALDNLFLPIDPPSFTESTLGGIVASNASGPSRFAHGTVRDYLLGISVIQPDGTKTRFGARVVKNVTGYDMCKLYTGSFGTLGILCDFYFKLKPIPPLEGTVLVLLRNLQVAQEALKRLLLSPLVPTAVELLNPEALKVVNEAVALSIDREAYAFALRFGDVEDAVNWQIEEIERRWDTLFARGIILRDPAEQELFWEVLREDRIVFDDSGASVVKLKVNHLPSQLVEVIEHLESLKRKLEGPIVIKSHAGNGVIRAYVLAGDSPSQHQKIAKCIAELRSLLKSVRGGVVVESAPSGLKRIVDVWGVDSGEKALMKRIKEVYDSKGILNPGRFVV